MTSPSDFTDYPSVVAEAVATLRETGVAEPYGIALGPRTYRGVIETTERGGYVVFDHLRKITGGPLVWARFRQTADHLNERNRRFPARQWTYRAASYIILVSTRII